MGRKITVLAIILGVLFFIIGRKAWAQERNGCGPAMEFSKVAEVYLMTTPTAEAREINRQMQEVRLKACRGDFARTDTITYPNGQIATSSAGDESASWSWSNGSSLTPNASAENASVYYPDGSVVSTAFRRLGANFSYPDGRTMAASAGEIGRAINDMNGNTLEIGSPNFAERDQPEHLDAIKFLTYVEQVNMAAETPTAIQNQQMQCSAAMMSSRMDRAQALIQGSKPLLAVDEINDMKMCL
jgi:hypothetical protein